MTSIAFTGDITFSKYVANAYQKADLVDRKITDFLCSSDHVVANIEAPVTAGEVEGERKMSRANPPESVEKLLSLNARIWNLANNHATDCKAPGIRDTLDIAEQNGICAFGAGLCKADAARFIELPGSGGIGMFGVTYYRDFLKAGTDTAGCITWEDEETIRANITEIKKRNRWCVIVAHCGQEFSNIPMPYVRRRYLRWLELGADVIVGHHPHVVQNYEQVGEKLIFYSLGNFILDTDYQRKQKYSEYGVLVKLNFTEDRVTWEHLGTWLDRDNSRVESCASPAIFTNIDPKEYRRLLPLGVRDYLRNHRVARIYLRSERAQFNALQWFKDDLDYFGTSTTLELYAGYALAYLGLWKRADKKLVDYLR